MEATAGGQASGKAVRRGLARYAITLAYASKPSSRERDGLASHVQCFFTTDSGERATF